jgi:hypothetical protein
MTCAVYSAAMAVLIVLAIIDQALPRYSIRKPDGESA